jgi:hypothetical protein
MDLSPAPCPRRAKGRSRAHYPSAIAVEPPDSRAISTSDDTSRVNEPSTPLTRCLATSRVSRHRDSPAFSRTKQRGSSVPLTKSHRSQPHSSSLRRSPIERLRNSADGSQTPRHPLLREKVATRRRRRGRRVVFGCKSVPLCVRPVHELRHSVASEIPSGQLKGLRCTKVLPKRFESASLLRCAWSTKTLACCQHDPLGAQTAPQTNISPVSPARRELFQPHSTSNTTAESRE